MSAPWIMIALCGLPLAGGAWLFNRLVAARNRLREAWSGIEVQLKRRASLIPNLVATVQAYATHEHQLLEELTRIRGQTASPAGAAAAAGPENQLSHSLQSLLLLVEAYPELKADQNFRGLQEDLVEIEDELQLARRYYNGAVRDFNNRVESFPANLLAGAMGFGPEPFFEIDRATERGVPPVDLTPARP